jgi:ribose transport system ATP-binding protein
MSPASGHGLRLLDVTKSFPGVRALKGVSLEVRAGEVHGLVGENGAGKSTLVSIAGGELTPDSGSVEIAGQPLTEPTPRAAQRLGLAEVHQHPALAPDLSVAENLYLGLPGERRPRLGALNRWATEILRSAGVGVPAHIEVARLTQAQRHQVEIAKALALSPKALVLDEPTEALDRDQIDALFAQVREVAAAGTSVVYISHRIREVREIADRITVLRDGEVRGVFAVDQLDEDEVIRLIVGRPLETTFPAKGSSLGGEVVLRAQDLSGDGFSNVSLDVRAGEIVGLGGIAGNGQREFLRAISGLAGASGTVQVAGAPVRLGSPERARSAGLVHIPSERHAEGLFLSLPVRPNVSVTSLPRYASGGFVRGAREGDVVAREATALAIRTPSIETGVATLSGGNQQKVMMARAKLADARVLLVDEPTQGVDAGGRVEIFQILRGLASSGAAVVVVASDARELAGLCDRVLTFSRGRVGEEFTGADVTEEKITGSVLRSTTLRESEARAGQREWLERLLAPSVLPPVVLAVLLVLLGIYATQVNSTYLTSLNLNGLLILLAGTACVAMGQLIVVMVGSLDLSVGPLTGLLVVIGSFYFSEGASGARLVIGLALMLVACLLTGAINGLLAERLRINPVIATLAMFFVLQGVSLILRPTPEGLISGGFASQVQLSVGFVPVAFIIAVVLAVALQWGLRRTWCGLALRSVGSAAEASRRLGVRVKTVRFCAYLACSLACFGTGVLLLAQIGIGDAGSGADYTLLSLTAVLLGGASVRGGRGTFIGALLGAALIHQTATVATFLRLSPAWNYWLTGLLALAAVIAFSRTWRQAEQPAYGPPQRGLT